MRGTEFTIENGTRATIQASASAGTVEQCVVIVSNTLSFTGLIILTFEVTILQLHFSVVLTFKSELKVPELRF